ncbi:hypothetical protein TDB9533_04704 [Thalassocella blandensis]|nr:hypothetical protein TDB9533_04704 [Thalassocella blandensis]
MHGIVFLLCLIAFALLALSMSRHCQVLMKQVLSLQIQRVIRILAWSTLALALLVGMISWNADIGITTWLGWLGLAGIVMVLTLTYWPNADKTETKKRPKRKAEKEIKIFALVPANTIAHIASYGRWTHWCANGFIGLVILFPLGGFTWSLANAPVQPLKREDAYQGTIKHWSYIIAEKQLGGPTPNSRGQQQKEFVIRFCETCNQEIKSISIKLGRPVNGRAINGRPINGQRDTGSQFNGRGATKSASLIIHASSDIKPANHNIKTTMADERIERKARKEINDNKDRKRLDANKTLDSKITQAKKPMKEQEHEQKHQPTSEHLKREDIFSRDQDLWLTVIDQQGEAHHQQLSLTRISPSLFQYLSDNTLNNAPSSPDHVKKFSERNRSRQD